MAETSHESWEGPRGPSTAPSERRRAVPTEDHRLDHLGFGGVVPYDEHVAGTVLVRETPE